jgi:hypothetical protein
MFLKRPYRTHMESVVLAGVVAHTAKKEVPNPDEDITILTRTPIVGSSKNPNGCLIQIKCIKFILTGQIPIAVAI